MITSIVLDGARIESDIEGKFVVATDQPAPAGADAAPSPFDLFLAGVASCTGYFAQRYCRKWNLPHEGIRVELEPVFDDRHALTDIRMTLRVPAGFPPEHRDGLLRNANHCPVKKALEKPPAISLALSAA